MAYKWIGMRIIPWDEVQELHKNGKLAGCYRLYPDNSEGQIDSGYTWEEMVKHHDNGGEFGEDLDTVELELGDGKKITAPVVVDVSRLDSLGELEYSMWATIEEYLALFGIRTEDDQPDWHTVKVVQDKLFEVLQDAGVNFNFLTKEQHEAIGKAMAEKEARENAE